MSWLSEHITILKHPKMLKTFLLYVWFCVLSLRHFKFFDWRSSVNSKQTHDIAPATHNQIKHFQTFTLHVTFVTINEFLATPPPPPPTTLLLSFLGWVYTNCEPIYSPPSVWPCISESKSRFLRFWFFVFFIKKWLFYSWTCPEI